MILIADPSEEIYMNIPSGEIFYSPRVGSSETNGTIVFNASGDLLEGTLKLDEPVYVEIENGYIVRGEEGQPKIWGGKEAEQFIATLKKSEEAILKRVEAGELDVGLKEDYLKKCR